MKGSIVVALILLLFYISFNSCRKDDFEPKQIYDTLKIVNSSVIMKNIPIEEDTVLFYDDYHIDFRLEIENYSICKVKITTHEIITEEVESNVISTDLLYLYEKIQNVSFFITTIEKETNDTVFFNFEAIFKQEDNLAEKYVNFSKENGKLKLTWNELDKANTVGYLVERIIGKEQFNQKIEVSDSILIDEYYVGEEVTFNISVINKENEIQKIWHITKEKEDRKLRIIQKDNNYTVNVEKCPYYNNFGSLVVYQIMNYERVLIANSDNINDSTFTISNASFANDVAFHYEYYPKVFPSGANEYTSEKYDIYNYFDSGKLGNESFSYDGIAIIDNENIAYTWRGDIYKYNLRLNKNTDSIVDKNAAYEYLFTTPAGEYLYAIDRNAKASLIYLWATDKFTASPNHTFQIQNIIPPISDNLTAIMSVPSNTSPSNLALYDVTTGNNLFTTDYSGTSDRPKISSNGQYIFIGGSYLKLCSFKNNIFNIIWEESDWTKSYSFYDFNPMNNEICYTWDSNKLFSIRNTSDYSEINSFSLNLEKIINIDYYTKRIMGYILGKVLVYNLDDGTLEKEIPANIPELVAWLNKTIIINGVIFNNQGVKYIISEN